MSLVRPCDTGWQPQPSGSDASMPRLAFADRGCQPDSSFHPLIGMCGSSRERPLPRSFCRDQTTARNRSFQVHSVHHAVDVPRTVDRCRDDRNGVGFRCGVRSVHLFLFDCDRVRIECATRCRRKPRSGQVPLIASTD
jgi:hypothetical protein